MNTMDINGVTYSMAANLRVAFMVQKQNAHAPYLKIFTELSESPVEQQINVLFASLKCANADFPYTEIQFRDYCLDNMNASDLLHKLMPLTQEILGNFGEDEDGATHEEESADQKN